MTIQVPFRLRRRALAEPAVALLIPTRDPAPLLALCARRGLDPTGRVFDVAGGFVLQLESAMTEPEPGAIRLRERTTGLYVPADADLVPALLDDEANGLVRDWGLVFLPNGRVLLFDRHTPVELRQLLEAERRPRRVWKSLPGPRRLAKRLEQIVLDLPEPPADALYREFQEELRSEGPRGGPSHDKDQPGPGDPDRSTTGAEGLDQVGDVDSASEGSGAARVGRASTGGPRPSVQGLTHAIRGWFSQAGQTFSNWKEKTQWELIDHSTLLRKLVREFREGDATRALRRAVPIMRPDEPATPMRSHWLPVRANWLPWSNAIYNLVELLRRPGRGESVSFRLADAGVIRELAEAYHKAAEEAVRQGDFRRAAYIYGMLLRDDRMAANALMRGGLHRDAATLYLKKLNDPASAAQAFEAAGDVDRAIALYRQLGQHEKAGDLLRRIGEEDAAIAEYLLAAEKKAAAVPADYLSAGSLLLNKVRRMDLAIKYFQMGWDLRPNANARHCAFELTRLHAERGEFDPIWKLLDEADAFFETVGSHTEHGAFYCGMMTLARQSPPLESFAEKMNDRALLSLGRKLGRSVETGHPTGPAVSSLFGGYGHWPAAVVRDADFAATTARKRSRGRDSAAFRSPRVEGVQLGIGTVTAACQAWVSGELFVGFDNGTVLGFQPGRNQVIPVAESVHPVAALAVDPDGETVVALRQAGSGTGMSCSFRQPDGSFQSRPDDHIPSLATSWLTPILPRGVERLVGLGDGCDMMFVDAASGMHWGRLTIGHDLSDHPATALLFPIGSSNRTMASRLAVLTHNGPHWIVLDIHGKLLHQTAYHWQPAIPSAGSLRSVPIAWRHVPPFLELVSLDKNGAVSSATFHAEDGVFELLAARVATVEGGYLAATRCGNSMVVAVGPKRIVWLGLSADRFHVIHQLDVSLPSAVACFAAHATPEILIVCSDGFIARVEPPPPSIKKTKPRYDF
jgi:tetratricopeptide (TPR) repeat protein